MVPWQFLLSIEYDIFRKIPLGAGLDDSNKTFMKNIKRNAQFAILFCHFTTVEIAMVTGIFSLKFQYGT